MPQPSYSDASSTYWPPGWSFSRWSNATKQDFDTLPEEERYKTIAGLREVLGQQGLEDFFDWCYEREVENDPVLRAEREERRQQIRRQEPNWLRHWNGWYGRRGVGQVDGKKWGFVGFRGIWDGEGDDERWEEFKRRVGKVVGVVFERDEGSEADGFGDAREQWEVRWVEDEGLRGLDVDGLRERYKGMRDGLPDGLRQEVFLVASPKAVESVLGLDVDLDGEGLKAAKKWREGAPYLLAVLADDIVDEEEEDGHGENEWLRPVFRVAAEVLVDEFWWVLDSDITPLRRTTRFIKGDNELGTDLEDPSDGDGLEGAWWSMMPSPARMSRRRRG